MLKDSYRVRCTGTEKLKRRATVCDAQERISNDTASKNSVRCTETRKNSQTNGKDSVRCTGTDSQQSDAQKNSVRCTETVKAGTQGICVRCAGTEKLERHKAASDAQGRKSEKRMKMHPPSLRRVGKVLLSYRQMST